MSSDHCCKTVLYITKQSSIVLHSTHLQIMHTKNMCYIAHIQTIICYIAHIQVCTHLVPKTFKTCTHLAHSSCLEDMCYVAPKHPILCYIAHTLTTCTWPVTRFVLYSTKSFSHVLYSTNPEQALTLVKDYFVIYSTVLQP